MGGQKLARLIDGVERIAVLVNFAKHDRMQLVDFVERLEGVVQASMKTSDFVPCRRDARERNVSGLSIRLAGLAPRLQSRVDGKAVRTTVPKDFHDLHLVGR